MTEGPPSAAGQNEDPILARRRRTQRWIAPLTALILLIAVLIYFLWGRAASPAKLDVNGVAIQISAPVLGCGETERVTAIINTNGAAGTIEYEWLRGDGTVLGPVSQSAARGDRHVSVALDWSFEGYGSLDASAGIRILGPGAGAATAEFAYHCAAP